MTINWKPGKTEALIAYRGKEALRQKTELYQSDSSCSFAVKLDNREDISINVVAQYKRLGTIIDGSRTLVPEAHQRAKPALNSFVPLAMPIFGSKSIAAVRRTSLAWALVMSRLTFNIHVWSSFTRKARTIIYAMYMKVWRRIIGDPRFGRTRWNDREMRVALQMPSLDCFVRRCRLKYFGRLASSDVVTLHATLQARGKHGECMPWVTLLVHDLRVLRKSVEGKLDALPDPAVGMAPYWELAMNYPNEWSELVDLYFTCDEDCERTAPSKRCAADPSESCFRCCICDSKWESWRQLCVHKWAKHGVTSDLRRFVGDTGTCPVCHNNFKSRARLLKHLSERRVRAKSRKASCQQLFMESKPLEVVEKVLATLKLETNS